MIRISNLSAPLNADKDTLHQLAAEQLGLGVGEIANLTVARQSIDARKKQDVHYVYTLDVTVEGEEQVLQTAPGKNLSLFTPRPYTLPPVRRTSSLPPVVVGMGPAGLFAALFLARNGLPCILLERGQDVDRRAGDVTAFWQTGVLNPESNVQFGEGGAGTFSDGKLTTGTHDPRISAVLNALVAAGAPEDILSSHKPHIGTDVLRQVVKSLREELLSLGCEIRFGHRLTGLQATGHQLTGVRVTSEEREYDLPCDALILAPGHSARDTFSMLLAAGVPIEAKPFAIGVRIEHPQTGISLCQYGPAFQRLPPADYKLACHLPDGRSAFTFCVCPGGAVVAAASEPGHLTTNGMSRRARDGELINGGLLVGVDPSDFGGTDPLAGVEFQRRWEQMAFQLGGGDYRAPVQRLEDFLAERPSEGPGAISPTYRPGVTWTNLSGCLPPFVTKTLQQAIPLFQQKVRPFGVKDAVLTGVETRSSSPVRILRDEELQSSLRGLYPCGEGAGYAGGIISAAVDGIRVSEAVARGT